MVCSCHHPYRFAGRVETALRGGLCPCMGSDVNLATRLLVDGSNGEYEQAVVVSNDADFVGAMRYVRDDLGLRVTLGGGKIRNY